MNPSRKPDNFNNRTWLQAGLALSAAVVVAAPFLPPDLTVPRAAARPVGQLTWVQSGLALTEVTASPFAPMDLPVPRALQRPVGQLTWTQSGLALSGSVTSSPFAPLDLPVPRASQRPVGQLTWTQSGLALQVTAAGSTTTIYPNGDGTIGNWTDQASGTTNLWAVVDEPVASPDDADYIMSGSAPSTVFLLLGDMPGDFVSMGGTIVVKFRGRHTSSSGSRIEFGAIGIVESDETTALTDTSTPTTTLSLDVYTLTLNVTGATTKAAWDGARLKMPTNSGFLGQCEVTAIQVDVTYNGGGSGPGYGTNQNASILLAM